LEPLVEIVAVDATVIRQAIIARFPDFEDGVQYFAAQNTPLVSAIITRDPKRFSASSIPVMSPGQALIELDSAV
jgi:hypothetical protein